MQWLTRIFAGALGVALFVILPDHSSARPETKPQSRLSEWPYLDGDSSHTRHSDSPVLPPSRTAWSANVGSARGFVAAGERLYAYGYDFVLAIDCKSGRRLWKKVLAAGIEAQEGNPFAIADDDVVLFAIGGTVRALRPKDGAELWKRELPHRRITELVDTEAGGTVVGLVGDREKRVPGALLWLDRYGNVKSRRELNDIAGYPYFPAASLGTIGLGPASIFIVGETGFLTGPSVGSGKFQGPGEISPPCGPMASGNGRLFCRSNKSMCAFDPRGRLLWKTPFALRTADHHDPKWDPPIVTDKQIIQRETETLWALDQVTGRTKWRRDIYRRDPAWSWGSIGAGNAVLVVAGTNKISAVLALSEENGRELWYRRVGGFIWQMAVHRGALYVRCAMPTSQQQRILKLAR